LHHARSRWVSQIKPPGQLRHIQPARPDRTAQLMRDHPVLQLLHAAAKFDQFGPQAGIIGLPHIAGHQMIGQTSPQSSE
jgi:hypothetical protein